MLHLTYVLIEQPDKLVVKVTLGTGGAQDWERQKNELAAGEVVRCILSRNKNQLAGGFRPNSPLPS